MAHRDFTDANGTAWQVWDVVPTLLEPRIVAEGGRVRPRFLDGWLAFQSKAERRRLAPIPSGWEQLGDAELDALCTRAEVLGPPRRLIE